VASNNIQVIFTNSGTSDPNDAKKFDAQLVETDTHLGLTKGTVEKTLGIAPGAGLVFPTVNSARGRPKNGVFPMAGLASPFKIGVLEDDNATVAYELEARKDDAEAKYTTVVVSGVNPNDANDLVGEAGLKVSRMDAHHRRGEAIASATLLSGSYMFRCSAEVRRN
jgi:hypothetical protein